MWWSRSPYGDYHNIQIATTGGKGRIQVEPNLGSQDVARKVMTGATTLGIKEMLATAIGLGGSVVMLRLVTPTLYGKISILNFLIEFVTAFGDMGLNAQLVRQQQIPSLREQRTVFTVQVFLAAFLVFVTWVSSSFLSRVYHIPSWSFRLIVMAIFIRSFGSISIARLERDLSFRGVAWVEIAESIAYFTLMIVLVSRHAGVSAVVFAILGRVSLGTLLYFILSPWRIGWGWDRQIIHKLFTFGIFYQSSAVVGVVQQAFVPVVVGAILGSRDVGDIRWAETIAWYGLLLVTALPRMYLPAFSRLVDQREHLAKLAEKVIWGTNSLVVPLVVFELALIKPLTVAVFGSQWIGAIPIVFVFSIRTFIVPIMIPVINVLDALGKSKITFIFSSIRTAGTWIFGALFILIMGPIGVAVASVGVQLSHFILTRIAQREVPIKIFRTLGPIWLISAGVGFGLYSMNRAWGPHYFWEGIGFQLLLSFVIYSVLWSLWYKKDIKDIWDIWKNSKSGPKHLYTGE